MVDVLAYNISMYNGMNVFMTIWFSTAVSAEEEVPSAISLCQAVFLTAITLVLVR